MQPAPPATAPIRPAEVPSPPPEPDPWEGTAPEVYAGRVLERASKVERRGAATMRTLPVASTRLPAHPASSRAARAFVADHLLSWDVEEAVDDATLLVSELVTAAVLHVRTPIDLVVRKVKSAVRVEVLDDGRRANLALDPDFESAVGRGFSLVEVVASRWGIEETGGGQTVWFEIAL